MLDSNNHHQPCDFSETLVSYLYGEATAQETLAFQMHLAGCGSCAAEFAEFGAVRSSVIEWRDQEFAPMGSPAIELPVEQHFAPVVTIESQTSWIEGLRRFFTFTPGFAMAGVAVMAVCAGLVFIALNSQNSGDRLMAGNNSAGQQNMPAVNSAKSENINGSEKMASIVENKTAPAIEDQKTITEQQLSNTLSDVKARRSSGDVKAARVSTAVNTPKPKTLPVSQKKDDLRQAALPTLPDDYEDDSLRLADLFAEADTF